VCVWMTYLPTRQISARLHQPAANNVVATCYGDKDLTWCDRVLFSNCVHRIENVDPDAMSVRQTQRSGYV